MNKKIITGFILIAASGVIAAGCGLSPTEEVKRNLTDTLNEELSKDYELLKNDLEVMQQYGDSNGSNTDKNADRDQAIYDFDNGKIKVFSFSNNQKPEVINIKDEILGQNGDLINLNNEVIQGNELVGQRVIYDIDKNNDTMTLYNGEIKDLKAFEQTNNLENYVGYTLVKNGSVIWYLSKDASLEKTEIVLKGYDTGLSLKYSIKLNDLFSKAGVDIDIDSLINNCVIIGNEYKKENNSVIYIRVDSGDDLYPIDVEQSKLLSYKGFLTSDSKHLVDGGTFGYDIANDIYGDVNEGIIYNADGTIKADLSQYEFSSFDYISLLDVYRLYNDDELFLVSGDGKKIDASSFGEQAISIKLLGGYNKEGIIQVQYENKDGDTLYGFSNLKGETIIEPELIDSEPNAYVIGDYLSYNNKIYNVQTKEIVNNKDAFSELGDNEGEFYYVSDKHIFGIISDVKGDYETEPYALVVIEKQ